MKSSEEVEIPVAAMQLRSNGVEESSVEESSTKSEKDSRPKFRMVANSGGVIENLLGQLRHRS